MHSDVCIERNKLITITVKFKECKLIKEFNYLII